MYHLCIAPVGNQEPYNQAPPTNSYSAFPMHRGTVPSENPMPYGGPNTENGPLNNSVGQMPNQSTQVQSASVPPTSQVVNNQVAFRRKTFGMTSGVLSIESGLQRVTWKVPGFFQLQKKNFISSSPEIYFAGDCYRLRLYLFPSSLIFDTESRCVIELELCRGFESMLTKQTPTVSCELRLMSVTGNEIELNRDISRYSFFPLFFIERRELTENMSVYVPDGTLTIICYLSVGKPSIAGGPHPEEEQKGLRGVVELQSDYKQLLKKGAESDACLVVSGKEFRAHKNILRARSPVFDAMFGHDTAEKKSGLVVIDDLDPEIFGEFLEYLYTGGVGAGLSNDNAFGLYTAADKYDVPTLKSECVAYMRRNLSVECFCDAMTVALRHSEYDLQQQTARFLKENLERIIVTPKWKQFVVDSGTSANELLIKVFVPGEQ